MNNEITERENATECIMKKNLDACLFNEAGITIVIKL